MFNKLQKENKKRLNKQSKAAAAAIRHLYDDEALIKDFDWVAETMRERSYGEEGIKETIFCKLHPEGFEDMKLNTDHVSRTGVYQELGMSIGKEGRRLVGVFRAIEKHIGFVERPEAGMRHAMVITCATVDGRELSSVYPIERDNKERIGKFENGVHAFFNKEGNERIGVHVNITPETNALVVGYTYGLRDRMLGNLLSG